MLTTTKPPDDHRFDQYVLNLPAPHYVPQNFLQPPADLEAGAVRVMHLAYEGWALKKGDDEGFAPINAATLQSQVHNYREGINWLVNSHQLDERRSYRVGEYSRGFRWSESCGGAKLRPAPPKLDRKLRRRRMEYLRSLRPVHRHLFWYLSGLELDLSRAKEVLEKEVDEGDLMDKTRALATARLIADGRTNFTVCQYGRCHSAFSRLAQPLRQCVTLNGQSLVGLDISASQPLILGLLLDRGTKSKSNLLPPCVSNFDQTPPFSKGFGGKSGGATDDVEEYLRLCETGTLYEYLLETLGIPWSPAARKTLKERFFTEVLYGRKDHPGRVARIFAEQFPTVYATVQAMKRNNYRHVAHRMQKAESRLVIGTICRRLMDEQPETPIVTVHDSLWTPPQHVESVAQVMREEFQRKGLSPTLRRET